MTLEDVQSLARVVLSELANGLIRRLAEEKQADPISQITACLLLAVRATSLLRSMERLITPSTQDVFEVTNRGFTEARDLLFTFRFDKTDTRIKIAIWFEGKKESAWKADHKRCEQYLNDLGHSGAEFARKWSQMSTLAHPTKYACDNSATAVASWTVMPVPKQDFVTPLKIADHLVVVATFLVLVTYDLPGLVSVTLDQNLLRKCEIFHESVQKFVARTQAQGSKSIFPRVVTGRNYDISLSQALCL